ncbi:hypothetical protein NSND_60829 [Nitrospira sp. ND1]|nr:hypothetical protein NSND_60829 [Nitrospira sp. ND1]
MTGSCRRTVLEEIPLVRTLQAMHAAALESNAR